MSNTNFNNHPLIKNSNQYFFETKYISIHSIDRDITKYPRPAEFEIMLPQEYLNVASARLYSWSFPANYDVFSIQYYNVIMTFKFTNLYNPGDHSVSDPLLEGIFAALYSYYDKEIILEIETGFYNPDQMATELTNKFNAATTQLIDKFFDEPENAITYATAKSLFTEYNRFVVVYNSVQQKLWFGNEADRFIITNESVTYTDKLIVDGNCFRKNVLPQFTAWGLPYYLGFTRCNSSALSSEDYLATYPGEGKLHIMIKDGLGVPRFFYGDAISGSGDNGYWLLPKLPGATVYFLQTPFKIAFLGEAYIYMEIDGLNCIDETSPYALSTYTSQTNQTNSIVNSSFAKIAVPTTPISQWFDNNMGPYKYWNPPAERIGKMKIKLRYHNGSPVEFGQFEYSFMLELNLLKPQQQRSYSIVDAAQLGQLQSYGSKYV